MLYMRPFDDDDTGAGGDLPKAAAWQLVVLLGGSPMICPLPASGRITVGRSALVDVVIPHTTVSRQHAILDLDAFTVIDLGGRNGTHVRGTPAPPKLPIAFRPGDTISIGNVTVVLQPQDARAPTRPSAPAIHELPLELRLGEECARSARHGTPFVHARLHVSPTQSDTARDVLAETLRDSDVMAEDAPGQFQLLLPETEAERGRTVVQRLAATLARHDIAARTGTAAYPYDGINAGQLSARARALAATPPGSPRTAMDEVRRLLATVATGDLAVLITGETGVGKELIAEMVHRTSPRARKPFVRVNCAAISETLLESELFGHARGAFTGADDARVGLVETADGGTLFLDEIGEMSLRLQTMLLRVLEDKVVRRVGESTQRALDIRIVCATNRSLPAEVEAQRFRRDLYYRIGGVTLAIPPLRERPDEIEGIARAFTALASARTRRAAPALSAAAIAAIRAHAWQGNIRELRNTVERAVLLSGDGPIQVADLGLVERVAPAQVTGPIPIPLNLPDATAINERVTSDLSDEIAELERRRIVDMLEQCGGNQTRAARALGLSRNTLLARLNAYGLRRPRKT